MPPWHRRRLVTSSTSKCPNMQLRVICLQLLVATASATVASDTASASKRVDGSRSAAYGLGIVWASQPVRPNETCIAQGWGLAKIKQVQLTPLGLQLACLPLDPRLGKLLLLSCLCGVLEQARSYP